MMRGTAKFPWNGGFERVEPGLPVPQALFRLGRRRRRVRSFVRQSGRLRLAEGSIRRKPTRSNGQSETRRQTRTTPDRENGCSAIRGSGRTSYAIAAYNLKKGGLTIMKAVLRQ